MPKETVLVVDDEEPARNAVTRLLTANGYSVHALSSGEEAIEYTNNHVFDVLLCDFRMPGLDGLTTVRAIRKINPQIVAIIMTGNTSIDLAVQSLNLGVHGFIVKPFHGYELLTTIERTVERQSLIQENIKMKALVQIFEASEALISAGVGSQDSSGEERLFRLTLDFAIRETEATDGVLFLLNSEGHLEPIGLAYKDLAVAEARDEDELYRYTSSSRAESGTETDKEETDVTPSVFLQPAIEQFWQNRSEDWPVIREKAQVVLEAGATHFFVDDELIELDGHRVMPQKSHCLLLIAMVVQGRKIGVLGVRRRNSTSSFTEVDLQTAAILAGQAAIALDNSRLFRRLAHIEALREADQLRSEFVSTVTHELRTPLTSIKGYATTLLRPDVRWNDTSGREYLSIISEECDKLMHLIDNILEVSKIEAGVLRVYPEPTQVREILDYAVTEARRRSPEAVIELSTPSLEELPLVMADSQRIIQVLRNLISNAIKYSQGQATIKVTASTPYYDETNVDDTEQQVIKVSVRDLGAGLSPEHLARVFERFYRVDVGIARKTEGTGLGLAICKGIVDAHNGRIWVESEGLGQGSTFSFTLPVANANSVALLD